MAEDVLEGEYDYKGNIVKSTRQGIKKRVAIFQFVNFVARNARQNHIHVIAPPIIQKFQNFIYDQGWPSAQADQDLGLRGNAYEGIGLLAKAAPEKTLLDANLSLFRFLIDALREDSYGKDITFSIEDALSNVMIPLSKKLEDEEQIMKFHLILIDCLTMKSKSTDEVTRGVRSARFMGTKYANHCLPYSEYRARWINILAINIADLDSQELLEEGKKGLDPFWHQQQNYISDLGSKVSSPRKFSTFPSFMKLMRYFTTFSLEAKTTEISRGKEEPKEVIKFFRIRYGKALGPAFLFCRQMLLVEVLDSVNQDLDITLDWDRKLNSLFSSNDRLRMALRAYCLKVLESGDGLLSLADLLRAAFEDLVHPKGSFAENLGEHFVELCTIFPEEYWLKAGIIADIADLQEPISSNDPNLRAAAAQAFGMIGSHESCDQAQASKLLSEFLDRILSWEAASGEYVIKICGSILAVAHYFSRKAWRLGAHYSPGEDLGSYLKAIFSILSTSRDSLMKEAVFVATSQLCLYFVLDPTQLPNSLTYQELVGLVSKSAKAGNTKAILAMGHLSMIVDDVDQTENSDKSDLNLIEEELYACHEIKEAETQFTVGEALSCLASGWQSGSLSTKIDVLKFDNPQRPLEASQKRPTRLGSLRKETFSRVLKSVLRGCTAQKPSLRKASVLQLLSLLEFDGDRVESRELLPSIQRVLKTCLSHRDEIVQEAASRALGLVYEKGTPEQKDELVRDLVNMFSDNKSGLAGNVTEDTQLFEPGALPTGDGSISTYKDILNLASEVGDSSLVYRFMSLASNNSIWTSRAAFGKFGLSNVFSDSSVDGYLAKNPKIYPKLYRYRSVSRSFAKYKLKKL